MKRNGVVLVCVTPQYSCKKLIEAGASIARTENCSLRILSVFPKRQCYSPDIGVLEVLNSAATELNAAMTVCFSDSPVKSVAQYAGERGTRKVVVGFPGSESSSFVAEFHSLMPEMPLSMVDNDMTAYEIAPLTEENSTRKNAVNNRDFRSLTYKIHMS